MEKKAAAAVVIVTLILSLGMHWNKFSWDLCGSHLWRQTQTQWNIINFYQQDANILNPRVAHFNKDRDNLYRYEFPLMQWSVAMVHKVAGDSITVTRICVFLIGLASLAAFYLLTLSLFKSHLIASFGVWALNFSPVFYYWTINPLPDNLALCFGLWYLYFLVKNIQTQERKYVFLSAFFLSLATLTKLPFVVFGAGSVGYAFLQLQKTRSFGSFLGYSATHLLLIVPAVLWYAWVIPEWGTNPVIKGVFSGEADWVYIGRILTHHRKKMFPEFLLTPVAQFLLFPALLLLLFRRPFHRKEFWCLAASLFFVGLYFAFELTAIGMVHDYYIMPFLPFLYVAIVYTARVFWQSGRLLQVLVVAVLAVMPFQCYDLAERRWTQEVKVANDDLFTHKQALRAAVPDDEQVIIINDVSNFIFAYLIQKQGYVFRGDYLPTNWIENLSYDHDVKYMYSDSRIVDEREDVQALIDTTLLEAGSIRVFRLK